MALRVTTFHNFSRNNEFAGAISALLVAQRRAHRFAEAERDARRGFSGLAQARPPREEGRERHPDSRPNHSEKAESNAETEPDESSVAVGFRAAYVFDISQTDGQPVPEIGSVNGDPHGYRERLARFVAERGIALEYSDEIAPARGTSSGGKITLLPGQSPAEEFATLAHEVAHEMMHRDERRSSTSKRIRETEAEAVAFVVCSAIDLETGSAAQDYIGLYGGDAKLLSESLEYVQRTATQVLNAIGADESSAPVD